MLPYTTVGRSGDTKDSYELARQCTYDLLSVVVHVGEIDTGHYVSYCRVGDQVCPFFSLWKMAMLTRLKVVRFQRPQGGSCPEVGRAQRKSLPLVLYCQVVDVGTLLGFLGRAGWTVSISSNGTGPDLLSRRVEVIVGFLVSWLFLILLFFRESERDQRKWIVVALFGFMDGCTGISSNEGRSGICKYHFLHCIKSIHDMKYWLGKG